MNRAVIVCYFFFTNRIIGNPYDQIFRLIFNKARGFTSRSTSLFQTTSKTLTVI
jgi:hypothetical protein